MSGKKGPFDGFGDDSEEESKEQLNEFPEIDLNDLSSGSSEGFDEETEEGQPEELEGEDGRTQDSPKGKKRKNKLKAVPKGGAGLMTRILLGVVCAIFVIIACYFMFFYEPGRSQTPQVNRLQPKIVIPQGDTIPSPQSNEVGLPPLDNPPFIQPEPRPNVYAQHTPQPIPSAQHEPLIPGAMPTTQANFDTPVENLTPPSSAPAPQLPKIVTNQQDDEQKQMIMALREQVSNLQTAIMSIGDSCTPREQQTAIPADQLKAMQDLTTENEKLTATKTFLVEQNKEYLNRNNFLRQSEKDKRKQVEEQQQVIESLKLQVQKLESKSKAPAKIEQHPTPQTKVEGSKLALPEGWRIIGICPTLVSLENQAKQKTVLLEIGEKIEGIEIKGINIADNVVITSNGVAKYIPHQ